MTKDETRIDNLYLERSEFSATGSLTVNVRSLSWHPSNNTPSILLLRLFEFITIA